VVLAHFETLPEESYENLIYDRLSQVPWWDTVLLKHENKCQQLYRNVTGERNWSSIVTVRLCVVLCCVCVHFSPQNKTLLLLLLLLRLYSLCWAVAAYSVPYSYIQSVTPLGRGISPSQGRYLHTEQHKHRINADKHPCLEWDSNTWSQRSSGRRRFMS
jgi:hypothetical protein